MNEPWTNSPWTALQYADCGAYEDKSRCSYSRSQHQTFPRKCVVCSRPEMVLEKTEVMTGSVPLAAKLRELIARYPARQSEIETTATQLEAATLAVWDGANEQAWVVASWSKAVNLYRELNVR